MCGRYNLLDSDSVRELLEGLGLEVQGKRLPDRYNIAPTEQVPVVVKAQGETGLEPMRWWLTPAWAKAPDTRYSMFNARSETLATSPAFKPSLHHQRCIFPLSSFIEWRKEGAIKQPYLVEYQGGAMAVAGLWSHWQGLETEFYSCTMITTAAVTGFEPFHHRQPAYLSTTEALAWLNPDVEGRKLLHLLRPQLPQPLRIRAIDPAVNSARNKTGLAFLAREEMCVD
ncbi:MAG: SOS response-associated peptidase [Oceanospirillaceae bacterium]|nr:SOS response-associated peptidase [Oceanospirillaceae bacterium]